MKKAEQNFLGLIIICFLIGGLSGASAGQIVGNYRKIMKTDTGLITAAKFAVKQEKRKKENRRLSLVSIERAESQVVAGRNYKMCIKVINNGKIENVNALVYLNAQNKYSLTSWKTGACEIESN